MSVLGNSTQSDYDKVAQLLRSYDGAEAFVLEKVAAVSNGLSQLLYPNIFLAVILLALASFALRLQPQRALRYTLFVLFVAVLMIPTRTEGGMMLPAAPYYVNMVTSDLLRALMEVVDNTIKTPGARGNFAAPLRPLSLYAVAGNDKLRGSGLAKAMQTYRNQCSPGTQNALSLAELRAVGLADGPIAVDTPETKKVKASALKKLESVPGFLPTGYIQSGEWRQGFLIESSTYWRARNKRPDLTPTFLLNTDESLKYPPDRRLPDEDYLFVARDCAAMYRIVERGAREYYQSLDDRMQVVNAAAGIGNSDKERDSMVLLGAQLVAASNINDATQDEPKDKPIVSGFVGDLLSGLETLLVTAAIKLVTWISEFITQWFVAAVPGLGAMAVGFAMILWPLVVLLSLVPGRESSLGLWFWTIVYVKVAMFTAYLVLKVGGLVFTQAVDAFSRSGGETSFAAVTLIGGLVVAIAVIWGAPAISYMVVFSQAHGLAHSVGMGAIGGAQIQRAAGQITARISNAIPSARGSAGTNRGANKLSTMEQSTPPSANAVSPNSTSHGGRTLKAVSDRVSQESEKK